MTVLRTLLAVIPSVLVGSLVAFTPVAVAAPHRDDPIVTTVRVSDPNDADGRLDLIAASHSVRERASSAWVRFTLVLQAPIGAQELHRHHRVLIGELDTDGRSGAERSLKVYGDGERIRADLVSNATREVIRRVPVRLLAGQRITLRAPREQIGARRIFWYSYYHRTGDPLCGWQEGHPVTCSDSVPGDRWLRLPVAAWPAA